MNRRHFIQLTGASLGSLLLPVDGSASGQPTFLLKLPSNVEAQTDQGWDTLEPAGNQKWVHFDLIVQLITKADSIAVYVQSPSVPLKAIRLSWDYECPESAVLLGDHWERSYGDLGWKPAQQTAKMPWYFIQQYEKDAHCFGVKTGCNTICNWQVTQGTLKLVLDTRNGGAGVQLGSRQLHAADIVTAKSKLGENTFAAVHRFCGIMCDKPRLPKKPVYGINDWYFAYGNNSAALILEHTALLSDLATNNNNSPFSVIDAGWAKKSPLMPDDCCWQDDYSQPNDKFKDMHKLADDIKKLGMLPGLWMRPLCARHDDPVNLLLPKIPGRDDAKSPILDPSIEENIERIKSTILLYRQWGYTMVKHDYSAFDILGKWGFQMEDDITTGEWHFNDTTKTTAEIFLHLYRSIREAAGDMYVIGCNSISHLSAGLFELDRIGDDTSGNEWERTKKMGVNTLGFRMVQHNKFYAADGDCVGLTNKVPWQKNKQWMQLLAQSSAPLFISAQPDVVGAEQKQFIKDSFNSASKLLPLGEPLDWMETISPAKWKLNGQLVNFDWG